MRLETNIGIINKFINLFNHDLLSTYQLSGTVQVAKRIEMHKRVRFWKVWNVTLNACAVFDPSFEK